MNVTHWITKKGKKLPIKEMSTLHIQKCISMLKKNNKIRQNLSDLADALVLIPLGDKELNKLEAQNITRDLNNYNLRTDLTIQAFESELLLRGEVYNPNYQVPTQQ